MDQPELRIDHVASDAVAVTMTYSFEYQWSVSVAARPSGKEGYQKVFQRHLDAYEAHAFIQEALAHALGL